MFIIRMKTTRKIQIAVFKLVISLFVGVEL